jgi:hypothetical protein
MIEAKYFPKYDITESGQGRPKHVLITRKSKRNTALTTQPLKHLRNLHMTANK